MITENETDVDYIGLSVDMLDVDRLREWAGLLLVHGADISHWGSVPFVASKMQTLATCLEKAIRDIGVLRNERARLVSEIADAREACPSVRMQDNFDAPLLALVNLEVSRGFNRDAEIYRMRAALAKTEK